MYGTETVTTQNVELGTLVIHDGRTWRASANTNGYLYLQTVSEVKRIRDSVVDVVLNGFGQPEVMQ